MHFYMLCSCKAARIWRVFLLFSYSWNRENFATLPYRTNFQTHLRLQNGSFGSFRPSFCRIWVDWRRKIGFWGSLGWDLLPPYWHSYSCAAVPVSETTCLQMETADRSLHSPSATLVGSKKIVRSTLLGKFLCFSTQKLTWLRCWGVSCPSWGLLSYRKKFSDSVAPWKKDFSAS